MKYLALVAVALVGIQATALEVTSCNFSGQLGVESIEIVSGSPGTVSITYTDQSVEVLPAMNEIAGLFNQIRFTENVASSSFRSSRNVYTKSPVLGDVFVRYNCSNRHSDIYCISRGGRADKAVAEWNIDGNILKFNHQSGKTCEWSLN